MADVTAGAPLLRGIEALLQPVEEAQLRAIRRREAPAIETAATSLLAPQRMPVPHTEVLAI